MSKIILIGDSHISLGYPNSVDKWTKVHQEYFTDFLIPLLEREVEDGDIIIHLGDLFDNRNVIPINLLNYGMEIVEKISSIAPLHILVGNHDCWHKSSSEINTIRPFRHIPNVFIYDKTTKIEYCGKSLLMMPFIEKRVEQVELLKKYSGCDYLFCHSDLNGARMHLSSVGHKNMDKIDVKDFGGYKNVYSGHIHIVQRNKNFTFIGNNFEMDRNDMGNQKGIFILNTLDGSERFIPNEISPKFKKVYIKVESDIESLDGISTKDYIDLYISNSLLLNNRKLRRKLESMLDTGNFASVEFVDDISSVNEEIDVENITVFEESDESNIVTLKLEYTEMIYDFINNQNYDSDKIKCGVIGEFSEIVRIYDDNYKST